MDTLGTVAFLSGFEFAGGAVLGNSLRQIRKRELSAQGCFLIFWGVGFAGIPLFIGFMFYLQSHSPLFFVQVAVLVGTILLFGFMPDALLDTLGQPELKVPLVGAGCVVIGGALLVINRNSGLSEQVLTGMAVVGIGAVILGVSCGACAANTRNVKKGFA